MTVWTGEWFAPVGAVARGESIDAHEVWFAIYAPYDSSTVQFARWDAHARRLKSSAILHRTRPPPRNGIFYMELDVLRVDRGFVEALRPLRRPLVFDVSGLWIDRDTIKELQEAFPGCEIVEFYGPRPQGG